MAFIFYCVFPVSFLEIHILNFLIFLLNDDLIIEYLLKANWQPYHANATNT